MKYVIIGNSAAAVGCVEGIRQVDREGGILMVSREPQHTYSRPLISYLLQGKVEDLRYRSTYFYKKNKCDTLLGTAAVRVRPEKKEVALEDGSVVRYEKLLLATGSLPFLPPVEGLHTVERRFSFLSLADARKLESAITPQSRVLIVGAGLIGLKCAEGLCGRVKHITVVDMAGRALSSILDETGSSIVEEHIRKQGVSLVLGDGAARFERNAAHLASGDRIDFDIMVMAAGVRPNTTLFPGSAERGIETDNACRTSVEGIYAAGDCAQSYDITSGLRRVLALLPNAYMQGRCAGVNMAGGSMEYSNAAPMNAIGLFGLHMITAGSYEGEAYVERQGENYKKLVVKDGVLNGYILTGNVERAGIYTALIREQKPLEELDFELIKTKPQLMAFSGKERARQLGGVV